MRELGVDAREHLADLRRVVGAGRQAVEQLLQVAARGFEIAEAVLRRAHQCDRLGFVGVGGQRALEQFGGPAGEVALRQHRERFGIVGEQARIGGQQARRLLERGHRFRVAALHPARLGEHRPGLAVVGSLAGALLDAGDERLDVAGVDRRMPGAQVEARELGRADPVIDPHRDQRHQQCERQRDQRRGASWRRRRAAGACVAGGGSAARAGSRAAGGRALRRGARIGKVFGDLAQQVGLRLLGVGVAQASGGALAFDLVPAVAKDRETAAIFVTRVGLYRRA